MTHHIMFVLYFVGVLLVVGTLLPFWRTARSWVRIWDFPRSQIAACAFALAAIFPLATWPLRPWDLVLLCAVCLSAAWQLSWVWPYLPGAPIEVRNASKADESPCVSFMTTNVHRTCRDAVGLLAIIHDADPDIILAVETDLWWCEQLNKSLCSGYAHSVHCPQSNGYGMALFSRFKLVDPEIRFLIDQAIPSIKTGMLLRSGAVIDVYGLHPRPPAFDQNSNERDAELMVVGREVGRKGRPAVLLGDLNDVAWSQTTLDFKAAGSLKEPRRGRGLFNTYPAATPFLRYPLDYIFHTAHFSIKEMRVLPRFRSDHLPLMVVLCLHDGKQPNAS